MKQIAYLKLLTVVVIIGFGMAACRQEAPLSLNVAAMEIKRSEKLSIPEIVAVPDNGAKGNTRVATYYAEGVQKYKAQLKSGTGPAQYEWVFVAPQANLYNMANHKVGTHGAGPFWEISPADSIFAQAFTPARSAPSPDVNSIDWLLLMPKTGKAPTGLFAEVSYIQRIATVGGKAPSAAPKSATETVDVKYKAVYRFTRNT